MGAVVTTILTYLITVCPLTRQQQMYTYKPIQHHTAALTGEKFILVPAPRFLGCTVDPSGKPLALKYPDHRESSTTGLRLLDDLKGLNTEDLERYKPSFILYRLHDGTLLKADKGAILKATSDTNSATDGLTCLKHLISDLVIAEMPEVVPIPIYQF